MLLPEGQDSKTKAQEVRALQPSQEQGPVPPAYQSSADLPAYGEGPSTSAEDDGFGAVIDTDSTLDDSTKPPDTDSDTRVSTADGGREPLPAVAGQGIGAHAYYVHHNLPVVLRIGPHPGLNLGAIAFPPGSKQIEFRWFRGPAWSRTRILYDKDGKALLKAKRYTISRRGFWSASDPETGETILTMERNGVIPLGLRIRFRNVFATDEGGAQRQTATLPDDSQSTLSRVGSGTSSRLSSIGSRGDKDRPEVQGPAVELQAKYTFWRGWSVTSVDGRVFAEYSMLFGHDYDMTVAPHCDTLVAAFCGMVFREIEVGMRQSTNSGLIDLARKGVAMASSRQ